MIQLTLRLRGGQPTSKKNDIVKKECKFKLLGPSRTKRRAKNAEIRQRQRRVDVSRVIGNVNEGKERLHTDRVDDESRSTH